MVYLACEPLDDTAPQVASPAELVEVCWLDLHEVNLRMPDLPPVRTYLTANAGPLSGPRPD